MKKFSKLSGLSHYCLQNTIIVSVHTGYVIGSTCIGGEQFQGLLEA